jgi:hypothetical protein
MVSALAPGYAVVTVIRAFSICGYWRMTSLLNAWKPSRTISRLTTVASTGRRMKGSVKAMDISLAALRRPVYQQLRAFCAPLSSMGEGQGERVGMAGYPLPNPSP